MLAAWCASTGLTPRLEVRTVAIGGFQHEAIYLLLSRSNQPLTPWVYAPSELVNVSGHARLRFQISLGNFNWWLTIRKRPRREQRNLSRQLIAFVRRPKAVAVTT